MVRAEEAKVFGPVVPCISVNVIDVNRDAPGVRITFVPSAHATHFSVRRDQVPSDVARRFVETRGCAVNFSREPSTDVFFMMKSSAALVGAIDERVSADKIVAAAPLARNNLLRRYSHGSNDNG